MYMFVDGLETSLSEDYSSEEGWYPGR